MNLLNFLAILVTLKQNRFLLISDVLKANLTRVKHSNATKVKLLRIYKLCFNGKFDANLSTLYGCFDIGEVK